MRHEDISANWYAIRLQPGATRPAKDLHVEVGPRNGRKLVSRMANESVIERGCREAEIELFLPFESRMVIHHRTKKPTVKRLPLIPGFAFVTNVHSFPELEETKGVAAVLGIGIEPYAIPGVQIEKVMQAEAQTGDQCHEQIANWYRKRERVTRRKLSRRFPSGSSVTIDTGWLKGRTATVTSVTGRNTVKAMIDLLGKLTPVELPVDQIEKVA